MSIPQTDPRANYLAHRAEIDAAITSVLESGRYILGPQVTAFEQEFGTYLGVAHGVGTGNGTAALELALRACGIGPGRYAFTVSHTAVATVAAIELSGATPVLVDVDPPSFTLDPNRLEDAIRALDHKGQRRAPPHGTAPPGGLAPWGVIIPVHLYGHPADMPAILALASRYELWVVEDCAQSHGAAVAGRKTGTFGQAAAFSFYPTKNLGALGDGGLVATADAGLAGRLRSLREYGWQERYVSQIPGLNSRLDELQAAVLRVKLRYLDAENLRRQILAGAYNRALAGAGLSLPGARAGTTHVYHQYVVCSPQRDALQTHLRAAGIGTLVHYPVPVHLQPAYASRLATGPGLPHTESLAREILSLPMYPELAAQDVEAVGQAVAAFTRV